MSSNLRTTCVDFIYWTVEIYSWSFFFLRGFTQIVSSSMLLCLLKLDLGYFNFVIGERPQRRHFVNNCESAKPSCNVKLRWRGKFKAGTELRSFIAGKGGCARSGTLITTLLLRPMPNVELFMRPTKLYLSHYLSLSYKFFYLLV